MPSAERKSPAQKSPLASGNVITKENYSQKHFSFSLKFVAINFYIKFRNI